MNFQKNSLKIKVWAYLILFSVTILIFLWFFQVVSLNSYYEWTKKKELTTIVATIFNDYKNQEEETFLSSLDSLSHDYGVCIELYNHNQYTYLSNNYGRGCMGDGNPYVLNQYKRNFIESNTNAQGYILENPKFHNKAFMYALKLAPAEYAFVNVSLEPLDSSVTILKKQFIVVSILVLALSFIIAYFISKRLSRPIEKINASAKLLAKGNYDVSFTTKENISEIKELSDTLNQTREELSKTEALRREFMANVSHDLKTPLTMIKAYAEMVRDLTYKDKKKREENLNVIIKEADRLNLLVNDILELSTIQSNLQPLLLESFDFDQFLQDILKQYRIYIEKEDYQITYEGASNAIVKADPKRMKQVVYNLLNNAINYTGDDKIIKVTLNIIEDRIIVSIQDTGNGINEEEIPHIFEKYYKIDKSYSRVAVGTGIGLSIVKNILEQHHFIYGVHSQKGKGSTFYFELPKSK